MAKIVLEATIALVLAIILIVAFTPLGDVLLSIISGEPEDRTIIHHANLFNKLVSLNDDETTQALFETSDYYYLVGFLKSKDFSQFQSVRISKPIEFENKGALCICFGALSPEMCLSKESACFDFGSYDIINSEDSNNNFILKSDTAANLLINKTKDMININIQTK